MDCPQCHAPMDSVAQPGVLGQLVSVLLSGGTTTRPNFRCPKCYTEVSSPIGENFVLSVDNLEDFRKSCRMQLSQMRSQKRILGGFWTQTHRDRLARLERYLVVLDAMTPEERLDPDRLGPADHERLAAASATTAEDVSELFKEFTEIRNFYRDYREKRLPGQRHAWLGMVGGLGFFAAGVGAGVLAQYNSVVATVVYGLGYSFVGAVVVFACLSRVKRAIPLVFSSWRRVCLFAFVLPAALGAGLYLLLHEWVVRVGAEVVPLVLGCFTLVLLLMVAYAWISTELFVWKVRRAARVASS